MRQAGDQEQEIKQRKRAEHILDVAAQLLLRWGYKRVTIEEIARQADVGTGTIYLHWKTKEAIFECVLLREAVAIWRLLLHQLQADPQEALLHRIMRSLLLVGSSRPLGRALFLRDRELLGKLAQGAFLGQEQHVLSSQQFVELLRGLGLIRTDSRLPVQAYALGATISGFTLIDPIPGEEDQISLEEKAEAIAQTIRLAFEPEVLPSSAFLQERVVPLWTRLLEQTIESNVSRGKSLFSSIGVPGRLVGQQHSFFLVSERVLMWCLHCSQESKRGTYDNSTVFVPESHVRCLPRNHPGCG